MKSKTSSYLPDAAQLGPAGEQLTFRLTQAWLAFHNAYAAALEGLQLTPSRMLALAYIIHSAGSDQSSMAKALGINRASAMAVVDQLEANGLVRRESGEDRRTYSLQPTAAGVKAHNQALVIVRALEARLVAGMPETETRRLTASLERIVAQGKKLEDSRPRA